MFKYAIRFLVLSACLVCLAGCANFDTYESSEYEIKFGVLSNECGCEIEIENPETIPYVIGRDNLKFGYVIRPKTNKSYKYRAVLHMPEPPKTVEGCVVNSETEYMVEGLKTENVKGKGRQAMSGWLTEGDPEGKYRMVLFINNHLAADTIFNIAKSYNQTSQHLPFGAGAVGACRGGI